MENFKAYLTIEGSMKEEEIRRFTIDSDVATNFLYLREKLQCIFPILRGKRFMITWKDIEGDTITISSDEELRIALQESPESTNHKLFIILRSDEDKNVYIRLEEEAGIIHQNIVCDGCSKNVKGFRYKCLECADYDLCSRCEGKGLHSEHCMLRTAEPLQWSSRHGRRVAHHLKKFLRNSILYTGRVEKAQECPVTKEKHRRCHGSTHDSSVLETLVELLNDPPNYIGECPMRSNASKPLETATEATASCDEPQSQETKTEASQTIDLLKCWGGAIAPVLNNLGIKVSLNMKDDEKSTPESNNGSTNQADSKGAPNVNEKSASKPNNSSTNQVDSQVAPNVNEKSASKPNNSSTNQVDSEAAPIVNEQSAPKPNSASTSKADSKGLPVVNEKSGKSSDDDEWTIVNKEEKSSDADASNIVQTLHRPSNSLEHIDENVQREVVTPTAPVKEPSNGNLYPLLPQRADPQLTTPQPAAPQQILYHPDPKIQSAVVAMMDMGFSNERGSLTQMLVLKDGNIGKVLDMLSPV